MKKDFNTEFASLESFKQDQLFSIAEKNDLIKELLENLMYDEELFEPQGHILEDPEHIFKINPDEIKVEKYLNKEERAKLEEEERKRAEREEALKGDNVGQRGLKKMMGGTELIIKKDKGQIDEALIREDWMNKPEEEMNDEEKLKFLGPTLKSTARDAAKNA